VKVWIVLEGPDMTYYGDASIHGVFASQEEARAKLREIDPQQHGQGLGIEAHRRMGRGGRCR
jgi:hypothetical protein